MAIITVEGLGQVEIAGDTPTPQENDAIRKALDSLGTSSLSEESILSIEEYKEQNSESANIPDMELADALYKKHKGKINETDFYKKMFPKIAAERAEEEIDVIEAANLGMQLTPPKEYFRPTVEELAGKSGVSLNDPASSNARFAASLGYNQEQKILAIKKTLSTAYNQNIDVRVGPSTGELEYYNPEKKQYALVDKPGADMGDFADLGGDAMVIIPDIAATIGVGVLTGGAGGITAGAAAAMAGEYARLKLGQKLYGINKDMTDEQLWKSIKTTGMISFGAGVFGLGAIKTIKGINNMIKGRVVPDDVLSSLDDVMLKESDAVAKTINDALDTAKINSKLKYTLAEALDDPDLLATQAAFENVKRLGYVNEFRTFGRKQADALNNYFKILKSGFDTVPIKNVTPIGPEGPVVKTIGERISGVSTDASAKIPSTYDAGVLIQKVIKEDQNPIIKNIIKKQQQSEELLTKSVFNLPDGSVKITGVETRSIINDLGKKYKIAVKEAGDSLDEAAGVKVINTDVIAKAISELSEKEILSFVNVAKAEGIFKPKLFAQLADKNGSIPLARARETLKSLNQLIKDKGITGSATGESVPLGKILKLKSAFIEQVKKNAGKHYVDELENFNNLVIKNKQLLNNETISKLTSIENGILKVADEDVFLSTFKKGTGSSKAAKEVYDVIRQSPDALNAYKNSIYELYKTKVLTNGVPNLTKHNAFIKSYEAPLKQFFNATEFSKISRIGGLQKIIENNVKIATQTQDKLFKSFAGRLENGSPQDIFKKIYAPNRIGEIIELKKILIKNPEIYKAFQRNVLSDLNESVMTSTANRLGIKTIDAKSFDFYLNGKGGEKGYRAALEQIFGKEYVKNLDILNSALQISARRPPSRAAEGIVGNFFTDIIRARVGQFSRTGRMFTAARRIFTATSNRVIKNALLNPQSLKELVELKNLKPSSKRAAIILHKLGGDFFLSPEGDAKEPTDDKTSSNTSNIDEIIQTMENIETASLPKEMETGNVAQLNTAPLLESPKVDPAAFNPAPINQGLTSSEHAFLDEEEKVMRLRERGMA